MPEVSRFYGTRSSTPITTHHTFTPKYGDYEVLVNINTLAILGGSLPAPRVWLGDRMGVSASAGTPRLVGEGQPAATAREDRTSPVKARGSHNNAVHRTGLALLAPTGGPRTLSRA